MGGSLINQVIIIIIVVVFRQILSHVLQSCSNISIWVLLESTKSLRKYIGVRILNLVSSEWKVVERCRYTPLEWLRSQDAAEFVLKWRLLLVKGIELLQRLLCEQFKWLLFLRLLHLLLDWFRFFDCWGFLINFITWAGVRFLWRSLETGIDHIQVSVYGLSDLAFLVRRLL